MKKVVYVLVFSSVVISGLVFANRVTKNQITGKPLPVSAANAHRDDLKKWEASPDGIRYKKWETSPEGRKAHASVSKIRKQLTTFANMEAVITSISPPRNSSDSFGMMVKINGDDYAVNFGPDKPDSDVTKVKNDLSRLNSLKVGDEITIRSRSAGYTGKASQVILSGDYVEMDHKVLYKRDLKKGGC